MNRPLGFLYRLATGGLLGAQAFFSAAVAPSIFTKAMVALPAAHPARREAAARIGALLASLDRATLTGAAVAALVAIALARRGAPRARLAAVPPLLAGLLALASSALVTPAIQQLRLVGATETPHFRQLHGLSTALLGVEMLLFAAALWLAPAPDRG